MKMLKCIGVAQCSPGIDRLYFRVWVKDGASGPAVQGPASFDTLCYAENSDGRLSFVTLSSSPIACICSARIFLFKADGSWIFRLANGCFFLFCFLSKRKLCNWRANPSKAPLTCTAHRMRPHCWPRRNQHCKKSLESLLIGKIEIFRDEHEHGCRSSASPGCDQLSPSCSTRAAFRELKT